MRKFTFLVIACGAIAIAPHALLCSIVLADDAPPPATQPDDKPPLTQAELESLLAPIALYPDSLLTQMLMAATYPLEIVQADRWVKDHKDLQGDALATELEKQSWDPSVKSLVNFPDQLSTMSQQLDLTIKIGDAFIGQQDDVMNTVQNLRNKAQANGNLTSNDQQTVTAEPNPAQTASPTASDSTAVNDQAPAAPQVQVVQAPPQVITIESPSPQIVYVPTYNPTVVYGAWPYPTYPPPPYYPPRPPGYIATAAISFGVGVACGAAWGYAWGHSNWGHNNVNINVNQNVNFNTHINRTSYQNNYQRNSTNFKGGSGSWRHDPSHRDGVAYRDNRTTQKFGGPNASKQAMQSREQFRGREQNGAANFNRGPGQPNAQNRNTEALNNRGNNVSGQTRDNAAANRGNENAAANRANSAAGGANRDNAAANRTNNAAGAGRDTSAAQRITTAPIPPTRRRIAAPMPPKIARQAPPRIAALLPPARKAEPWTV